MANLDSQRKDVQCVINYPLGNELHDIEKYLSSCGYIYAYIIHDKDVIENGDLKTKHIHLVISSLKRHRLKYFLTQLCECFNVNENQVSIQPCDSVAYAIQYLIHKNDSNKYQYNVTSIRSNLNEGCLYDYLNEDVFRRLSTDDIIKLVIESNGNKLELISKLGIARYTLYRNTINDIYNNVYSDIPYKYK